MLVAFYFSVCLDVCFSMDAQVAPVDCIIVSGWPCARSQVSLSTQIGLLYAGILSACFSVFHVQQSGQSKCIVSERLCRVFLSKETEMSEVHTT